VSIPALAAKARSRGEAIVEPHRANRIEARVSRRDVIAMLGGIALASPRTSFVQKSTNLPLIAYLAAPTRSASVPVIAAFLDGLRELGYVEGSDYAIGYRFADERIERLPALARELVALPDANVSSLLRLPM
jgi:putative ABC transport system substrate-binding protein